ncbi:YrrS family protein [Pseudalkalibacillus hwajinpoensis]|uniref:YrrS family protein n=1 Tax=Guptibacillus hwajinpoensis TaxID=208199 RepID=UPI00146CEAB0|nr:YrrS family protein [Pseudalkalibacillus hwajinpoensis]
MRSRYGDRHSKRKQNIVLNSLIGLVLAVILVLVANIFFFGDAPEQTAGQEQQTAQSDTNEETNSSEDAVTSDEADSEDSDSNNSESADEDSNEESSEEDKIKEENKDKEKEKEDEQAEQEPGEPNLEGPWEPVGTSQSGDNHRSSYTIGSDDWNEKIKAVESVMGLSENEMTIWKIGGNGGPQQSYARVSKKGSGNQVYYIELEWIDDKGWKPISVSKE